MDAIRALVQPVVEAAGFALVRVAIQSGPTLQIMAEDPETGQLTLDQCAELSRAIDPVLEQADPIEGGYRLEVSSPGIDRPLTRAQDWQRWTGFDARAEVLTAIQGRKRFVGPILGFEGDEARIDAQGLGPISLPLANIRSAKLALTERLIHATRPLSAEGADTILKDRR